MGCFINGRRETKKEEVLQEALVEATNVPLEIAKLCLEAILLHEEYAKKGSRIVISDVGVGVIFCKAALQGAKLNVLINTNMLKDQEFKTRVEKELFEIEKVGLAKADEIYKEVEQRFTK